VPESHRGDGDSAVLQNLDGGDRLGREKHALPEYGGNSGVLRGRGDADYPFRPFLGRSHPHDRGERTPFVPSSTTLRNRDSTPPSVGKSVLIIPT
jgi:hypothetical protein